MRAGTTPNPQVIANKIVQEYAEIAAVAELGGRPIFGHPGLAVIAADRRWCPEADALIPWYILRRIQFWIGW